MAVRYVPSPNGKAELLKTGAVAGLIASYTDAICSDCNGRARTPHGQGKPYKVKNYRNNSGFPHSGVYTANTYACHHEHMHGTLKSSL